MSSKPFENGYSIMQSMDHDEQHRNGFLPHTGCGIKSRNNQLLKESILIHSYRRIKISLCNSVELIMKKLMSFVFLISTIFLFPILAKAEHICTRTQGSSINLRKGPGSNFPKGLTMVGSGGERVENYFRQRNYTIPDGEQVSIFSRTRGNDEYVWYKIGTNQWSAWVRSDFVCSKQ